MLFVLYRGKKIVLIKIHSFNKYFLRAMCKALLKAMGT